MPRNTASRRILPDYVAAALEAHDWPGNVRALRHACERAVILADGDVYSVEDFSLSHRGARAAPVIPAQMPGFAAPASAFAAPTPAPAAAPPPSPAAHDLNLERAEKQMVEQALKKHHYNISLAAQELGLTRASLYRRMDKHGL
jgi:DNA-binding NtrC family response regulator